MSARLPRRSLLAGAATIPLAALPLAAPNVAHGQGAARLLVVGGGFGGAAAARYARIAHPWLDVTLVEPQPRIVTCPYGNLVLAGRLGLGDITHSYDALRARGVAVVHDWVEGIDPVARTARLRGGATLRYDRMVLAPGIALRWGAIEGYDEAASAIMPHAWLPGDGSQIALLRRQLEAMPDGGVVGIAIPGNPYRCPPGPYERIGMVAEYLRRHKPRAKVLALDAKDEFSKQALFRDGWRRLYGDMVEWVPLSEGGRVVRVDPAARELVGEFGTRHRVDVANVIPPQSAAAIALATGLAGRGFWVPVDPVTFEARAAPGIHVVGDANTGAPMPKSGFVANNTAKQAVEAAAAALRGQAPPEPVYFNTCYSHVGPDYGISIVGVFRAAGGRIVEVPNSGGPSPRDSALGGDIPAQRRAEAAYADAWYRSITADTFG